MMGLDTRDITLATYRAGGATQLVDGFAIAAELGMPPQEIDAPLADAVDEGLLIRDAHPDTGRVAFRLAPEGQAMVDGAV
jgi:DNA-binding MarR family transcriptional regulator